MKEQIADAMWELAKKKDPAKITVKDLVTVCGISRQTFYYHYQDVFDVHYYIIERNMNKALQDSMKYIDNPEEAAQQFTVGIMSHIDEIRNGLNTKIRQDVEQMLLETIEKYGRKLLEQLVQDVNISIKEMNFLVEILTCNLLGEIIKNSIRKEMDEVEYSKQLVQFIKKSIENM